MRITANTKLCMVIGDPIDHSLSPQMHNAGYVARGIDDRFVYLATRITIADIQKFVESIRVLSIRGVSCTIPHKEKVMPFLDEIDTTAQTIGAVNTIVNDNGILKGYNTDWLGILTPLQAITDLSQKTVLILGAGGAARAAAYAVTHAGANLRIHNRTLEKAHWLAQTFGGEVVKELNEQAVLQADVIINTTAVGLHPNDKDTPLPKDAITQKHIVFDAVYNPYTTRLLTEAHAKGAHIIHGTEMLLHQGTAQFALYTGEKAPIAVMRKTLLTLLGTNENET